MKKMRTFSKRTQYDHFEETVRRTSDAIVSYEVPKKKFSKYDLKEIQPITYSQNRVFEEWGEESSLVLNGQAGTGKTLLAMYLSLREIMSGQSPYKKLVIIRSTSPVREMGFLPGDESEKAAVYELPYKQLCDDIFKKGNQYQSLKDAGTIEFLPTAFIRGITLNDSIVILDEAQNLNYPELSTVVTRVGKSSKLIICADQKQSDLNYNKNDTSGYPKFYAISKMMPSFRTVEFGIDDIVRSGLVKEFLLAENRYDQTIED
jgi:predicted ribonuclease YlaK